MPNKTSDSAATDNQGVTEMMKEGMDSVGHMVNDHTRNKTGTTMKPDGNNEIRKIRLGRNEESGKEEWTITPTMDSHFHQ